MKTAFLVILLTLTGSLFLNGCSLIDIRPPTNVNNSPASKQKIFFAHYDNVWRAAHASLKFPIAQENQDTGIIETEYIKGVDGWLPPGNIKPPSSGVRYKLIVTLAKGITDGRESTRLTIEKKMEILKNFFSVPEPIESDGLEESVLFYRIERELILIDALKKAN